MDPPSLQLGCHAWQRLQGGWGGGVSESRHTVRYHWSKQTNKMTFIFGQARAVKKCCQRHCRFQARENLLVSMAMYIYFTYVFYTKNTSGKTLGVFRLILLCILYTHTRILRHLLVSWSLVDDVHKQLRSIALTGGVNGSFMCTRETVTFCKYSNLPNMPTVHHTRQLKHCRPPVRGSYFSSIVFACFRKSPPPKISPELETPSALENPP